jgi:hypothetical protein
MDRVKYQEANQVFFAISLHMSGTQVFADLLKNYNRYGFGTGSITKQQAELYQNKQGVI